MLFMISNDFLMPRVMIQNGYSPENPVSIGVIISIMTDTQEGVADNIIKLFSMQIQVIFCDMFNLA